ncbi:MAG: hypothetical protein GC160_01190 [Acidobacteria bacterium]|nr:hypothetical protein [Acidobacteriota bacterium]
MTAGVQRVDPVRPHDRRPSRGPCNRGSAFVELSLVFGLFLAFVAATFQLGCAIWTWASLSHAVAEGVRFASMHSDENPAAPPPNMSAGDDPTRAAIEYVVRRNAIGISSGQLTVQVAWSAGRVPGSVVTVSAQYPFSLFMGPLMGIGKNMSIARSSSAPIVN